MNKVVILGFGWVGKSMYDLFPNSIVYDPVLGGRSIDEDEYHNILQRITDDKNQVNQCDIAFICVPTPNIEFETFRQSEIDPDKSDIVMERGALDTSIVEECIAWCECPVIVIRSTVNPGDCDRWSEEYGKTILYQPEYLGESPAHPMLDPKTRQFIIIGGKNHTDRRTLINLYATVYNANTTIRQMSLIEAEVTKLAENTAIAHKLAYFQELYDICEAAYIDYYQIREATHSDDPRFNLWWSFIFPDQRGFNSKCIPKDVYAYCAFAESLGYEPKITRAILEKNKEWIGGVLEK